MADSEWLHELAVRATDKVLKKDAWAAAWRKRNPGQPLPGWRGRRDDRRMLVDLFVAEAEADPSFDQVRLSRDQEARRAFEEDVAYRVYGGHLMPAVRRSDGVALEEFLAFMEEMVRTRRKFRASRGLARVANTDLDKKVEELVQNSWLAFRNYALRDQDFAKIANRWATLRVFNLNRDLARGAMASLDDTVQVTLDAAFRKPAVAFTDQPTQDEALEHHLEQQLLTRVLLFALDEDVSVLDLLILLLDIFEPVAPAASGSRSRYEAIFATLSEWRGSDKALTGYLVDRLHFSATAAANVVRVLEAGLASLPAPTKPGVWVGSRVRALHACLRTQETFCSWLKTVVSGANFEPSQNTREQGQKSTASADTTHLSALTGPPGLSWCLEALTRLHSPPEAWAQASQTKGQLHGRNRATTSPPSGLQALAGSRRSAGPQG